MRAVSLAMLLAGLSVCATPTSALAVVDAADYVVWRFPAPGARGLGLMHERASNTTLLAEAVGLTPNSAYRYVGSARSCGTAHRAGDVVWSRSFQTNAKGAALVDATVAPTDVTQAVKSIRLFRSTTQSECTVPLRYQSNGTGRPTDAFARLNALGAKALVFVDLATPNDRLTLAGHGFIASHGYRLVAADVPCPTQPTSGSTLFQKSGTTNSLGIMWRHDTGTNLTGTTPRSIQLFNPQNDRVACANTTRLPPAQ